jgi:predicted nucleic acid-binding protein
MVKALLDTNILIDFLSGIPEARDELGRHGEKAISIISWMEVMAGAEPDVRQKTRACLDSFTVLPLADRIAERAVELRRAHHIKLPDAVIWGTAEVHSMLLVTRNIKDFPPDMPGIRVPYRL